MTSDPSLERGGPEQAPPPYASLQDALDRVVSSPPWWRRWLPGGSSATAPVPSEGTPPVPGQGPGRPGTGRRAVFPLVAALGAVLVLSILGIAAPWNSGPAPARGEGALDGGGPVMLSPSPDPANPQPLPGRPEPGETLPPDSPAGESCQPPLAVVAAPDIAGLVQELAGALAKGSCPQVEVTAQPAATTLSTLAGGGGAPDVWIPGSSLWLRLATSGDGADIPTTGTSIARSPVVFAAPKPIADLFESEGWWPVWLVYYDKLGNDIPRMSMADPDTTVGALELVAFNGAVDYHWRDTTGEGFLQIVNFRDRLAATDADPQALFDKLATTPAGKSAAQVGMFPATEQQVLAYQDRDTATAAVTMGSHESMSEADYPLAVSSTLDERRAAIADELAAELRSPAAVQRFVAEGFRPPRGSSTHPAALDDTARFPDYPDPVALPDAAGWQTILEAWTWTG